MEGAAMACETDRPAADSFPVLSLHNRESRAARNRPRSLTGARSRPNSPSVRPRSAAMDIVGVDTAIFGVDDLDAARRFCRDYGFTETEQGAAGASFEALDGTGVLLRRSSDTSLPAAPVAGPTGRETVWGVRDTAALERIGAELSNDRQVRRDALGVLHTTDDDGLAIAFQVTRRHPYEAKPALQNVAGLPPQRPINHRVD